MPSKKPKSGMPAFLYGTKFRVGLTFLLMVPWVFPLTDLRWHQKSYLIGPLGAFGYAQLSLGLMEYRWSFRCNIDAIVGSSVKKDTSEMGVRETATERLKRVRNAAVSGCKSFEGDTTTGPKRGYSLQELYHHACHMEESTYAMIRGCGAAQWLFFGSMAALALIGGSLLCLFGGAMLIVFYMRWFASTRAKAYALMLYAAAPVLQVLAIGFYVMATYSVNELFDTPRIPGLALAFASGNGFSFSYTTWVALALCFLTMLLPWWVVSDLGAWDGKGDTEIIWAPGTESYGAAGPEYAAEYPYAQESGAYQPEPNFTGQQYY